MKKEFTIRRAAEFLGKTVILKGWVYNKRSSGSIVFLQLRDGTGYMQGIVIKTDVKNEVFQTAQQLTLESSVEVTGQIKEEKRAISGFELAVEDVTPIQIPTVEYPIGKKDHGPDFLLTHRHLWLRSRRQWAIQRVRNTIIYSVYTYFQEEGFIKIDAPILTPNACEGTTTLFPVPYLPAWSEDLLSGEEISFARQTEQHSSENPIVYLSQSGQLYLEAAIYSFGKVFDFGPTFRAEKSKTRRHLSEFWMMDAEMAYVDQIGNIQLQESLIVRIVKDVLEKCSAELAILERDTKALTPLLQGKFPVLTHAEAIAILQKEGVQIGNREDFGAEHETILSKKYDRPFFVTNYPKEVKAFYMKADPKDETRVLNSDMLAPEGYGEIIGGSQREEDYETLQKRMKEMGISEVDYAWYLDLRKFGSVVHSGFGLGLERIVAWVCKLDHVRETIPFPRLLDRFTP